MPAPAVKKTAAGKAPKKAAKQPAKKAKKTVGSVEEPPKSLEFNLNAAYDKRIRDAHTRVTNHKVFKGVANLDPITIKEGGTQAPFDKDQYKVCMERGEEYKCGGNALWCDPLYNPAPHVPVRMSVVNDICCHDLAEPPTKINFEFTIGVQKEPLEDPLARRGSLKICSAIEEYGALIVAIDARIDSGAPLAELEKWRKVILNFPFRFKAVEDEDGRYFESHDFRQQASKKHNRLAQTAMQWVFDIAGFKERKIKESPGKKTPQRDRAGHHVPDQDQLRQIEGCRT